MLTEPDYDTYGHNAAVDDVDLDVAGGLRIRFRRRAKNTLGWVITVPNDVTPYHKYNNYYNALSCFFVSCFFYFFFPLTGVYRPAGLEYALLASLEYAMGADGHTIRSLRRG